MSPVGPSQAEAGVSQRGVEGQGNSTRDDPCTYSLTTSLMKTEVIEGGWDVGGTWGSSPTRRQSALRGGFVHTIGRDGGHGGGHGTRNRAICVHVCSFYGCTIWWYEEG